MSKRVRYEFDGVSEKFVKVESPHEENNNERDFKIENFRRQIDVSESVTETIQTQLDKSLETLSVVNEEITLLVEKLNILRNDQRILLREIKGFRAELEYMREKREILDEEIEELE